MKTPTKILVLFVLAAFLATIISGCAQIVKMDEAADEDKQYTEIEDLGELGIAEAGEAGEAAEGAEAPAAEEVTGAVAKELPEVKEEPAAATPITTSDQIVVREGQLIELKPKAYDPDGDVITYAFSEPLDENGKWQTKEGDKGTYNVQITATAGKSTVSKAVEIVVKEKNKAPVLEAMGDVDIKVGDTITLSPKATDPNNDKLTFSYSGWMTSPSKTAGEDDVGIHKVAVTVSDGELSDSQEIAVKVEPKNSAPVMEKISDITVKEGETISFDPKAIDPDGDKVTITYSGWMTSATYTTSYTDAGDYVVKITASDGQLETSQNVKITVEDKDQPIVLEGWDVIIT